MTTVVTITEVLNGYMLEIDRDINPVRLIALSFVDIRDMVIREVLGGYSK